MCVEGLVELQLALEHQRTLLVMPPAVGQVFLYLSRLLQVVMVGGDCCEDRNHGQLNVSARKPLGGLLQAVRNQPIRHLRVHMQRNERHEATMACRLPSIDPRAAFFIPTTMQQSVEQSWSKLHGDVSSSTLYCSVQGSLSRTSFSTFQSVSYRKKKRTVSDSLFNICGIIC